LIAQEMLIDGGRKELLIFMPSSVNDTFVENVALGKPKFPSPPPKNPKMRLANALILLLLTGYAGFSQAQTSSLFVDLGTSSLKTASPDAAGKFWNNVTEAQTSLPSLVTSTGDLTGISLTAGGYIAVNPFGTTVPNSSTLGALAVPSATRDWFYVQGAEVLTLTLSNLPVNGVFRLSLFGSRDSTQTRITRFEVTGLTTGFRLLTTSATGIGLAPEPNANRSDLSVFDNISPAPNGTIVINVRREAGDYGYLGALSLEGVNSVNYPPAATAATVSGAPRDGSPLIGRYTYVDREQNPEAGTTFFWERAATKTAPPQRIMEPSTTAQTFQPGPGEVGYFVRLGVIPMAESGNPQGQATFSSWIGPVVSASTLTSFHIGSSFTLWANMPLQLKNLSQAAGQAGLPGYQLTAGRDSKFHWESGLAGGGFATGTPSRLELATGSWDVVVLQPYNSEWFPSSLPQMREYAQRFYTLADSHGAQFYLYDYWPWLSLPLSAQNDINAAFESVRASISVGGNKPALIIPSGPALKAVIEACGSGALSGYSRASFYRDDLHTNDLGSYVSALTHYATIFKKSPVGLPFQALDSSPETDNVVNLPTAVATRIQQIVWNTVGTYPNTGVVVPIVPPPPPPPPPVYVTHPTVTAPEVEAFAFGPSIDGLTAPRENLPHAVAATEPNKVALEYTINPDAETQQVTFTPEWSTDLVHWTATQPAGFTQARDGQRVALTWDRVDGCQFVRIYVVKLGS
jgi:hypothetical protein